MFKLPAILLVFFGIYIGVNYTDEINNVVESDIFERVQEKFEEFIDNKDRIIDNLK